MSPAPRRPARSGARKKRELPDPFVWHDIPTLRTFVSDRGKIRARRVTGLTPKQHRQVANAIKNAREMALLPYPSKGR